MPLLTSLTFVLHLAPSSPPGSAIVKPYSGVRRVSPRPHAVRATSSPTSSTTLLPFPRPPPTTATSFATAQRYVRRICFTPAASPTSPADPATWPSTPTTSPSSSTARRRTSQASRRAQARLLQIPAAAVPTWTTLLRRFFICSDAAVRASPSADQRAGRLWVLSGDGLRADLALITAEGRGVGRKRSWPVGPLTKSATGANGPAAILR